MNYKHIKSTAEVKKYDPGLSSATYAQWIVMSLRN